MLRGFAPSCIRNISASSPVQKRNAREAWRLCRLGSLVFRRSGQARTRRYLRIAGTRRGTGFSGPNKELTQGRQGGRAAATARPQLQQLPGGEGQRKRLGEEVQRAAARPVFTDTA